MMEKLERLERLRQKARRKVEDLRDDLYLAECALNDVELEINLVAKSIEKLEFHGQKEVAA